MSTIGKAVKTKRITTSIAVVSALLLAFSAASPAFAANPYIAGYTDQSYSKGTAFSGRNDFTGTTTTTPRDGWLAAVSSTGTFASASATDPTGWIHQQGTVLWSSSNTVYAQYNVFNQLTCVHSIGSTTDCSGSLPSLGTYGTSSSNIDFVYTLTTIDSTQVHYYWEPTTNGGSVTSLLRDYTKSDDSDPSNQFGMGTKNKDISGTTYKFKFYQFGTESSLELSQTWQVTQYDNVFGNTILSTVPAKSVQYTGATDGSWITYWGTIGKASVGNENHDTANSEANAENPTIPKGKAIWNKGTMTPGGTQLWT